MKAMKMHEAAGIDLTRVVPSAGYYDEIHKTGVMEAVIVVPASCSACSRRQIMTEGEDAGMEILALIEPSTAALYQLDTEEDLEGKTVGVLDLGDDETSFVIADVWEEEIEETFSGVWKRPDTAMLVKMLQEIRSQMNDVGVDAPDVLLVLCEEELDDRVLRLIRERFSESEIRAPGNCQEMISAGAAVYARMLQNERADGGKMPEAKTGDGGKAFGVEQTDIGNGSVPGKPGGRRIRRILPKSYGFEVINSDTGEASICNVLRRFEDYPVSKMKKIETHKQNQNVIDLKIYESDSSERYVDRGDARLLAERTLKLQFNEPSGTTLHVKFEVDENGILNVFGRDINGRLIETALPTVQNGAVKEK